MSSAASYFSAGTHSRSEHYDQDVPLVDFGEFDLFEGLPPNSIVTPLHSPSPAERRKRKKRRRLQGWRFGVALSASTATAVLMINLTLTIWASVRYPLLGGFGILYEGNCDTADSRGLWLHILVNGLSSILLSGSNYAMQCLTAPTRRECDIAHERGDWLDIGVAGVRNLSRISWQRRVYYFLLAVSSIPIHLLFNAAVFKTLGANAYVSVVANTAFLNETYASNLTEWSLKAVQTVHEELRRNSSMFDKVTTPQCISIYESTFLSSYSHVIAMTDETGVKENGSVSFTASVSPLDAYGSSWYV